MDWDLYLVTDRELSRLPFFDMIEKALEGGVTVIQIREKKLSTKEFIEEALKIKEIAKRKGVPTIINDRVDIALAVDADGIHLGNEDMPIEMARKIMGKKIIGASAHSVEEAMDKERKGANYIAVSPVFFTPTKPDAGTPLGREGIRKIKEAVKIPVIAIGGINKNNVVEVIKSGADGVAVVSAIVCSEDPEKTAREMRDLIKSAKKED